MGGGNVHCITQQQPKVYKMNIFYKSKEHCDNAKETYFQHMIIAIKISSSLLLASLMGFIPLLFLLYLKKVQQ